MSSVESAASHAYRVFSVSRHCSSSRFHRDGITLCTLHAEWGAVSQIVCCWNRPKWVSQETVVISCTAGWQQRHLKQNMQAKICLHKINKSRRDPYFDSWGCLCASTFVFTVVLVQLSHFPNQFDVGPGNLVRGTWYDPAHHSHCYLVIPIFWTSCISREMAVTLATIWKHIIWTMSWFHFIIVMRPVST